MLSKKGFIVLKSIMNMVNAIVLTLTGAILNDALGPAVVPITIIAFICAWLVTIIIPVEKVGKSFAGLFKLDEKSNIGRMVADVAIIFVYVVIINFAMTVLNVGFKMPDLFIAYIKPIPVLYVVSYIISFIISPIVFKIAMKIK